MDIKDMTRKEFDAVPYRGAFNSDVGQFDSLVILPSRKKHESGYRLMDFVACRHGEPICRLSEHSDILCLNGIGGTGRNWHTKGRGVPKLVPPAGWEIDCLPKSGLLNLFLSKGQMAMFAGAALSNFSVYAERKAD